MMQVLRFVLLALLVFPTLVLAQARKSSTIAELVVYRGADREQVLYAGAKNEGRLVWYTSLAGDSYKELVKAFETKYPGIKIDSYRAQGADLVVRLEEEAKARRNIADTIETTEGSLIFLRDGKLLRPYDSPYLDKYPEDGKERADKNTVYWALARESYIGFAYNKTLVPKDAVPKNFDGLMHPALKGKLGISIGQTSDKIIGAMIKTRSEEFVRKLKGQEIKLYSIDAPALVNNIAAGEIAGSPAIFQTHTLLAASKGAPVEWVPMDIVPTNVGGVAIAAQPPHPHAALLLADYLLGPEGQGMLEKYYYGNAAKNYGFKRWRPEHEMVLDKYEKELERWEKLLRETGRKSM